MADGKRRADKRQQADKKQNDAAERELEQGFEPGLADMETGIETGIEADADLPEAELNIDAQAAVDADIAAANSDIEAAAEDMGARQSLEPAQPGQARVEQHNDSARSAQPQFFAWPSVQPTFRRSKAEEANAFFAFTERLRQELGSNIPGDLVSVPVDPPDPNDHALFGPTISPSPPVDEENVDHDVDVEEYGEHEYEADDFYVGDDGYGEDTEDGQGDVEIDVETDVDEDDDPDGDPDGDESEY